MSGIKQNEFLSDHSSGTARYSNLKSGNTVPPDSAIPKNDERSKGVTNTVPPAAAPDKSAQLGHAVDALNRFIQIEQRDLEFEVIKEANLTVIKVVNRDTGELIRQFPEEEIVNLARKLDNKEPLHLFNALV